MFIISQNQEEDDYIHNNWTMSNLGNWEITKDKVKWMKENFIGNWTNAVYSNGSNNTELNKIKIKINEYDGIDEIFNWCLDKWGHPIRPDRFDYKWYWVNNTIYINKIEDLVEFKMRWMYNNDNNDSN